MTPITMTLLMAASIIATSSINNCYIDIDTPIMMTLIMVAPMTMIWIRMTPI